MHFLGAYELSKGFDGRPRVEEYKARKLASLTCHSRMVRVECCKSLIGPCLAELKKRLQSCMGSRGFGV